MTVNGTNGGTCRHSGRTSWSPGQCLVPSFCLFSAVALCFLEGSPALLERQRLWQSLPLRLQDPLPGPGLRLLLLPTAPVCWVTSPGSSRQDMAQAGSCLDPQPAPGCRIPAGRKEGMKLAPSRDRSHIQQQRSPQAPACLWIFFGSTLTAC